MPRWRLATLLGLIRIFRVIRVIRVIRAISLWLRVRIRIDWRISLESNLLSVDLIIVRTMQLKIQVLIAKNLIFRMFIIHVEVASHKMYVESLVYSWKDLFLTPPCSLGIRISFSLLKMNRMHYDRSIMTISTLHFERTHLHIEMFSKIWCLLETCNMRP